MTPASAQNPAPILPYRVHGLDLLRGACALLVVGYHVLIWKGVAEMHSWGLHGVYIFFVLSGTSLTLAYKWRFDAGFPVGDFLMLRAARLGPLFVLVSLIMVAHAYVSQHDVGAVAAATVLSTSLLFGLGNPGTTSLVDGGWSIGVEVVFYLIFPAILAAIYSRRAVWIAVAVYSVQTAFVQLTLSGVQDVRAVWQAYTQPMAFVAYFVLGCLIGRYVMSGGKVAPMPARIGLLAVMGAIVSLSAPTSVATVTGLRGCELFVLSVAATFLAAFLEPVSATFRRLCTLAGNMSYGVYLLHPVVFLVIKRVAPAWPVAYVLVGTMVPSMVLALLLERYYERPVRGLCRRFIFDAVPQTT